MPETIRILFVGEMASTHALSWIDLLTPHRDRFQVAAVNLSTSYPANLLFRVFDVPGAIPGLVYTILRRLLHPTARLLPNPVMDVYNYGNLWKQLSGLALAVKRFDPQLVHTFGFTPGALIYSCLPCYWRRRVPWVLQTRGGSDLAYKQDDPRWQRLYTTILPQAQTVICDNEENYRIFDQMGIKVSRSHILPTAPGTGGLDLAEFGPPLPLRERERLLVWSKAYDCQWSKALPVLEGLRRAWDHLRPLRCVFTAVDEVVREQVGILPAEMRQAIELRERIPRKELLALMQEAQVVLAPSLVDGIPNTLYEAMAAGAVPIVSPLASIGRHFQDGEQVIFARNLCPEEIEASLIRAFDDPVCTAMVEGNMSLVRRLADRDQIRERVARLYESLLA